MLKSSLLESEPDFVLEVFQSTNEETKAATKEATADLQKLLEVLNSKNFYIEIRPGTLTTLLVFIKLDNVDLVKAIETDKINNWIYGVNDEIINSNIDLTQISSAERLRIIYEILTSPTGFGGCSITPKVDDWNFIRSVMPVSNLSAIKSKLADCKFQNTIYNDLANSKNIEFILENFGTKYAFYHSLINTYNAWLLPLTVVGFLSNAIFLRYSLFYTFVSLTWAIGFYLFWKYTQLKLARQWGVSRNVELLEVPKSQENIKVPTYKRLLREISFTPTALVFVAWLVACQFLCFVIEIFLNEIYDGWLKPYMGLVPTIILTVLVMIVTKFYNQFVTKALDWENHSKNSTYHYSKVIKSFVFSFLTSYMALFITSFLYLPFGFKLNSYLPGFDLRMNSYVNINLKRENYEINDGRLNGQYLFFILTNQVVGLILEFVLPVVLGKVIPLVKGLLGKKEELVPTYQDSPVEKEYLTDVRAKLQLGDYDIDDDYRQLVLQFGFLVLFGPVWSLGPLISVVVELIQQKMDFIKLLSSVKTPVPGRADSIFPWDDFLKFLVWIGSLSSVTIAIMYNSDIVASASRSAVGIRWWKIVGPALLVEHLVYLVIRAGEKIIEYYVDYLDTKSTGESVVREKYLDTVYQKKSVISGEGKSLNDISALLQISAIIPQQLTKAESAQSELLEKAKADKELDVIDAKIAKATTEKLKLDELYELKNSQVKDVETSHAKKLDALATESAVVDSNSQGLISEKGKILSDLKTEASGKLEQLDLLKQQKAKLEEAKLATTGSLGVNEDSAQVPILEKLKQYVPESVLSTAEKVAIGATATATTVAATAQSKLVDLQGSKTATSTEAPKTPEFDMQDGDRIITSKANVNGVIKPVEATIDDNDHFDPSKLESQLKSAVDLHTNGVKKTVETPTSTATSSPHHSSSTPSTPTSKSSSNGSSQLKKSKSPLKTLFKKK